MAGTTWKPHTEHGSHPAAERDSLPDSVFAFKDKREEPLTDAGHVRAALARFDQVKDVTDDEREVAERDWRELGKTPHTDNPAHS